MEETKTDISPEEQQQLDTKAEDEKELKISVDTYRDYKSSSRGTWATRCASDRAYKFNAMWSEADDNVNEQRGQVSPTPNELIPTIGLVVAQLTENSPRFYAVGRERSDIKTASAVADLMAYIWYISNGDDHNKQVATDFEDVGMGCWIAYIDSFADNGNGEIKIMSEDPLDVYLNPASRCSFGTDSITKLIVKHFEEDSIKVLYPQLDLENIAPVEDSDVPTHDRHTDETIGQQQNGNAKKRYRVIDRYTKIKVKRFHVLDPVSGFEKVMTQDEYVKFAEEPAAIMVQMGKEQIFTKESDVEFYFNIIRTFGNTYHLVGNPQTGQPEMVSGVEDPPQLNPMSIPNSTRKLEIVTKGDLLREGKLKYNTPFVDRVQRVFSVGDKVVANYVMEVELDPIVLVMLHHSRNPYPMGDISLVKSLQDQLCKIDNLIITYNQNITNVKMFVQKGGTLKKELEKNGGKAGFQVYDMDMDVEKVPFIVQLTQMSSSFYQQRQNLILQIQRIIGAYSFQDGDATQAPQTARGTFQIDEMMQRRTASKRRVLESGLNKLGRVISEMIPLVYDKQKIFRIVKPNHLGKDKEVSINQQVVSPDGEILEVLNDTVATKFDIQVVSGSMNPINRVQRREEKLREYEIGILKNPKWYIRDMDVPDVEEIIEGEDALNQATQLIQQLQQEIKKLQGDLQTSQRGEVEAKKATEVHKFKADLEGVSSNVKSKADLAVMRMNDQVKEQSKKVEA
jgi:hypothetical protein